jgi:quercetin dioxygenase-like cupin family protein
MNASAVAELLAKVVSLEDLIAYQAGAVVSRTLIKKSAGTVTLFAFDAEQEVSEHTAPYDAMVYLVEGELDLTVAGKPVQLTGGQVMLLPADQPHALKASQRSKMLLVMIRA